MDICLRTDLDSTAIVLNDQLGRGRSSTTAIIVLLIQRWLKQARQAQEDMRTSQIRLRPSTKKQQIMGPPRQSWQIINSCLRVIRSGLEVKRVSHCEKAAWSVAYFQVVDEAIDATAKHFNVRDAIEEFRARAEEATDPAEKQRNVERGQ